MSNDEAKKKVPVKVGLYKPPASEQDQGHLLGSKCKKCGRYSYPQRVVCLTCYGEDMEEVALSTKGKIWTYTIARQGYPMMPLVAPFICAQVVLQEKVSCLSLITGCEFDDVKIGMDVELYFWKVNNDSEGNEVMAYGFKPVAA